MHPVVRYNTSLMRQDMAAKGWQPQDLAEKAELVPSTLSRFLNGHHQTARTAKKISTALGYSVRRYLLAESAVAS